jgi:hypothetical protein
LPLRWWARRRQYNSVSSSCRAPNRRASEGWRGEEGWFAEISLTPCLLSDVPQEINYDSTRGGVSVITEKGDITTSYLLIQRARAPDTGRYACNPTNANEQTVMVHVLNGKLSPFAITCFCFCRSNPSLDGGAIFFIWSHGEREKNGERWKESTFQERRRSTCLQFTAVALAATIRFLAPSEVILSLLKDFLSCHEHVLITVKNKLALHKVAISITVCHSILKDFEIVLSK